MTDKPEKAGGGKGFSGLDALVSDVSEEVEVAARKARARKWGKSAKTPPTDRANDQADGKPKTEKSTWIAAAIGLFTLLLCFLDPDFNPRTRGARVHPPPPPAVQAKPQLQAPAAPAAATAIAAPAAQNSPVTAASANGVIGEVPPPDSRLLNSEQYRYCLAEKIRIASISDVLVPSRQREMTAYNLRVVDFSSRCADQKFGQHPSEKVKADVDAQNVAIAREAKDSWQRLWITPTGPGLGKADTVRDTPAPTPEVENIPDTVAPAVAARESWTTGPYAREMSALNEKDRTAVESACAIEKKTGGRAAFLRCVGVQLGKLSQ